MRSIIWSVPTVLCLVAGIPVLAADQARINPTDPQPTCTMCPGTYIPSSEIDAYANKALTEKLLDQQVRDIDIGKAHIGVGRVHRGKLDAGFRRRTRPDQRSLSCDFRRSDAGTGP